MNSDELTSIQSFKCIKKFIITFPFDYKLFLLENVTKDNLQNIIYINTKYAIIFRKDITLAVEFLFCFLLI